MCLPDIIGVNVTKPGSLALGAISQTLKCQNLLPREGLFRRQPHEEMGEQISNLPWQSWRAQDTPGIKLAHEEHGGRWLEIRKRWGILVLHRCQLSYQLQRGGSSVFWGWSSGFFDVQMSLSRHSCMPMSVVLTSLNWLELKLDTADSRFLKKQLGKRPHCLDYKVPEGNVSFVKKKKK